MRTITLILQVFFLCLFWVCVGCEPTQVDVEPPARVDNGFDVSVYTHYAPVKIDIMPLTEFIGVGDVEETSQLNVYVSLLDSFGCQIKSPGVFRFELYKRVERSSEPKGKRIFIWPDIDLTERSENNNYWRDFLRAYEFNLDFGRRSNQNYVLQVTCLCPNGRRLSAEFGLEYAE